jgi:hypothetical protein
MTGFGRAEQSADLLESRIGRSAQRFVEQQNARNVTAGPAGFGHSARSGKRMADGG